MNVSFFFFFAAEFTALLIMFINLLKIVTHKNILILISWTHQNVFRFTQNKSADSRFFFHFLLYLYVHFCNALETLEKWLHVSFPVSKDECIPELLYISSDAVARAEMWVRLPDVVLWAAGGLTSALLDEHPHWKGFAHVPRLLESTF